MQVVNVSALNQSSRGKAEQAVGQVNPNKRGMPAATK